MKFDESLLDNGGFFIFA